MSFFRPRRSTVVRLAVLGAVLAGWHAGAEARAERPIRQELVEAARTIAKHLKTRSDRVAVGSFTCADPDAPPTNPGPGIYLILCQELERREMRIDPEARHVVSGTWRAILDASSLPKKLAIKIELKLAERGTGRGFELEISRAIVDEATVAEMYGTTVALAPEATETDRVADLRQQVEKPKPPHLAGSRLFATPASPYGIEVLLKQGQAHEPVKTRLVGGLAYADLKRDDVYAIRLINNSDHEAAVRITIDGLDLFAFSEMKMATLILPPRSTAVVPGWPISGTRSNEFLVTSYGKSAAYNLMSTGSVGVISASFAAAWPVGGSPPADEPKSPNKSAVPENATGHGSPVEKKYVPVERKVGVLRGTVIVRYTK